MASESWIAFLLLGVLATGGQLLAVSATDECNIEVQVNNSTFSVDYKFVSQSSSACDRANIMTLEPCDTTAPCLSCNIYQATEKSGTIFVPYKGQYKLRAWDVTTSSCFSVLGQFLSNLVVMLDYTTEALNVTMVEDVRVSKGKLVVYRVNPQLQNGTSIPCRSSDPNELEKIREKESTTTSFSFQGPFNPTDCLCFKIRLEGHSTQHLAYNPWFSTNEGTCLMPTTPVVRNDA